MVRVRFARSPTGSLHVGNALGAVISPHIVRSNERERRRELWTILAALARDETLCRIDAAL